MKHTTNRVQKQTIKSNTSADVSIQSEYVSRRSFKRIYGFLFDLVCSVATKEKTNFANMVSARIRNHPNVLRFNKCHQKAYTMWKKRQSQKFCFYGFHTLHITYAIHGCVVKTKNKRKKITQYHVNFLLLHLYNTIHSSA